MHSVSMVSHMMNPLPRNFFFWKFSDKHDKPPVDAKPHDTPPTKKKNWKFSDKHDIDDGKPHDKPPAKNFWKISALQYISIKNEYTPAKKFWNVSA